MLDAAVGTLALLLVLSALILGPTAVAVLFLGGSWGPTLFAVALSYTIGLGIDRISS